MTSAPFGAVKDVAILSAMAGNLVTLGLLVAMWPFIRLTELGIDSHLLVWSLGLVLVISLVVTFPARPRVSRCRGMSWSSSCSSTCCASA